MTDYKIQFTQESVLERFRQIRGLEDKVRLDVLHSSAHDLNTDIIAAIDKARVFCDGDTERYGKLPTLYQRAYVQNLLSSGKVIVLTLEDLIDLVETGKPKDEEINNVVHHLVHELGVIPQYLPATKSVLKLGKVSEKRLELLEMLDMFYGLAFYSCNLEFSKDFQRDVYKLKEDITHFRNSGLSERAGRMKNKYALDNIETKADYFKNAVLPLIKNIQQHAFNPENDVYGRLNDKQKRFDSSFYVASEVEENKKEITISVVDNGFGMKPEIQSRLFQKGASTKTDTTIEHGIGLWAVKEFIEKNGGRIWFETELGKGTKFRFTIPYREKHHSMYRQ